MKINIQKFFCCSFPKKIQILDQRNIIERIKHLCVWTISYLNWKLQSAAIWYLKKDELRSICEIDPDKLVIKSQSEVRIQMNELTKKPDHIEVNHIDSLDLSELKIHAYRKWFLFMLVLMLSAISIIIASIIVFTLEVAIKEFRSSIPRKLDWGMFLLLVHEEGLIGLWV